MRLPVLLYHHVGPSQRGTYASLTVGVNTVSTDLHALRRSMVQPDDSILAVACRAHLGWYPIQPWRVRLRIRSRVRRAAARLGGLGAHT